MKSFASIHRRRSACIALLAFVVLAGINAAPTAAASYDVIRVEEEWELRVGEPDPDRDTPQVSMIMSPQRDLSSTYFTFDLNHASMPQFVPGGLQIQVWSGEQFVSSQRGPKLDKLSAFDEVITWKQRIRLHKGHLIFEILSGSSATWGNFGGPGRLKAQLATSLANLNAYAAETSVANSGVTYADHRVTSLTLKRIRWYTRRGLLYEHSAPIVIHSSN